MPKTRANRRQTRTEPTLFSLESLDEEPDHPVHRGSVAIEFGPAESAYPHWPVPVCIVSDGPYGVSGYPGDEVSAVTLDKWYAPHIQAWSQFATSQTTLWFWNTELGWATVHPVLVSQGWEYRCCHVWDKGLGHVAGNANTQTLRKLPVVTEVCVQYVRPAVFKVGHETYSMQQWLRYEWQRSGLPLRLANEACGVRNAATRKYLTDDHLWYYPPVEAFVQLAEYANRHGKVEGRPYFSTDGVHPLSGAEWDQLRAKFKCPVGVTNVWKVPQVGGNERIRGERNGMKYKFSSLHGSQKPLTLMELIIRACTAESDVVWEPFGGLCPGAVICKRLGRTYRAAEIIPEFFRAAVTRMGGA